jgi:hypothetical protein
MASFGRLAKITEPRVEKRRRYVWGGGGDDDLPATAGRSEGAGGAPRVRVVDEQNLGPLRVVTLRGDDGRLVETWLSDHGYEPPDGLAAAAQRYLDRGWLIAAARLRGRQGERVQQLQPLIVRFPTRRIVYPMMSLPGSSGAQARVDVITGWPVELSNRANDDVGAGDPTGEGRLYGGRLPVSRYLTSFRLSSAAGDEEFVRAERDDYRQVRVVYEDVDVTGRVLGGAALLVVLIAAGVVLVRRRAAPSS